MNNLTGCYIGVVTNNIDPLKKSRVKVSIEGIWETSELLTPWVKVLSKDSSAKAYSKVDIPIVGTKCLVMFIGGDPLQGYIVGYIPDAIEELSEGYPDDEGTITANGILVKNDLITDTVTIEHPSGTSLKIDGNGNILVHTNNTSSNERAALINPPGVSLTIIGDLSVKTQGNVKFDCKEFSVTAENISMNSSSFTNQCNTYSVTASTITVNGTTTTINGNTVSVKGATTSIEGAALSVKGAGNVLGSENTIGGASVVSCPLSGLFCFSSALSSNPGTAPAVTSPEVNTPQNEIEQKSTRLRYMKG